MDTRKEIINLLCEKLGFTPIEVTEDKDFISDLCVDSLDMVEIITGIEERFGVKVDDKEIDSIKTVGDLIRKAEKLYESR